MGFSAGVGPFPSGGSSTAARAVVATGCSAGRQLLAWIYWESPTITISSLTVSGESNMTLIGSPLRVANDQNGTVQLAVLPSISAAGDKTITANFSAACYCSLTAQEVFGGDVAALQTGNITSTSADEEVSGNISWTVTTANANDLVFGILSHPGSAPAISGYTAVTVTDEFRNAEGYLLLDAGAAGVKTLNASLTNFGWWGAFFTSLKAAGSGGGGGGSPTSVQLERGINRGIDRGIF